MQCPGFTFLGMSDHDSVTGYTYSVMPKFSDVRRERGRPARDRFRQNHQRTKRFLKTPDFESHGNCCRSSGLQVYIYILYIYSPCRMLNTSKTTGRACQQFSDRSAQVRSVSTFASVNNSTVEPPRSTREKISSALCFNEKRSSLFDGKTEGMSSAPSARSHDPSGHQHFSLPAEVHSQQQRTHGPVFVMNVLWTHWDGNTKQKRRGLQ